MRSFSPIKPRCRPSAAHSTGIIDHPEAVQLLRPRTGRTDHRESILPVLHRTSRAPAGTAIRTITADRVPEETDRGYPGRDQRDDH